MFSFKRSIKCVSKKRTWFSIVGFPRNNKKAPWSFTYQTLKPQELVGSPQILLCKGPRQRDGLPQPWAAIAYCILGITFGIISGTTTRRSTPIMLTARVCSSTKNTRMVKASLWAPRSGGDSFTALHDSTSPMACQSFFSFFFKLFFGKGQEFVRLSTLTISLHQFVSMAWSFSYRSRFTGTAMP